MGWSVKDAVRRAEGDRAAMFTKMMTPQAAAVHAAPGGSMGLAQADIQARNQQYLAASRGIPFTAIRPIAIKAAEQEARVGTKDPIEAAKRLGRVRHKAYVGGLPGVFQREIDFRHGRVFNKAPDYIKEMEASLNIADEDRFLDAISDPNIYLTRWALIYLTVFSLEATGEAVWVLDRQGDDFDIWYFPRHWVTPVHDKDNGMAFVGWHLNPPGAMQEHDKKPIPSDLVCHFMYPHPANPMGGHSPIQAQSYAVNADDEIQRSQLNLTQNIQRPSMLITMGDIDGPSGPEQMELTTEQREDIVHSVRRMYAGALQFGDPFILDRVVKDVKPYMPGLTDLDYSQGSKLTKSRIMEGIGTNPIAAGQIENANRASAYVAHDSLYNLKVNPVLKLIGETLSKKLSQIRESQTTLWFDAARAKDPDLVSKRFAAVSKMPLVLKVGEARKFLETGEFTASETEHDDEYVVEKPQQAEPNAAEGGPGALADPKEGEAAGDDGAAAATDGATGGEEGPLPGDEKQLNAYTLHDVVDVIEYAEARAEARLRRSKALNTQAVISVAQSPRIDSATLVGTKNCGTGSGGFKPGNTCGGGGGSAKKDPKGGGEAKGPVSKAEAGKRIDGLADGKPTKHRGSPVAKTKKLDSAVGSMSNRKTAWAADSLKLWANSSDASKQVHTLDRKKIKLTKKHIDPKRVKEIIKNYDPKKARIKVVQDSSGNWNVVKGHHTLAAQWAMGVESKGKVFNPKQAVKAPKMGKKIEVEAKKKPVSKEMAEYLKKYPPKNRHAADTEGRFRDKDGYTPERQALHDKMLREKFKGSRKSPKPTVYMMGGGPAAGKGSVLNKVGIPKRAVLVDSDEIKKELPEYQYMSKKKDSRAAAYCHMESSKVSQRMLKEGVSRDRDVLFDGTGDGGIEKLRKRISWMKARDHKVVANYVTVDTEEAVRRSEARAKATGRRVPPSYIRQAHSSISQVVPQAIKEGLYDEFKLWSNNVKMGEDPKLVAEARGKELKIHNQKEWDAFVAKGDG